MTTIKLDHITKIEGHADLHVQVEGKSVRKVELKATEGARFFEAFVRGRKYHELPILTSPICGICSQAHVIAAIKAAEDATGITHSEQTEALFELLNLAQYIQSHNIHLHFLALPDYLGYGDAIEMLPKYRTEVDRALHFKRWASEFLVAIGGRDMHPVRAQVGGFSRVPDRRTVRAMVDRLKKMAPETGKVVELIASLEVPDFKSSTRCVSLKSKGEYATTRGNVFVSGDGGFEFKQKDYFMNIKEQIDDYSTAKMGVFGGKPYMVGALARVNNNFNELSPNAKDAAKASGVSFPSSNPFHNNLAQAIELVHSVDRVIELADSIKFKNENWDLRKQKPQDGRGVGAVEAPRGTLYHDYTVKNGIVQNANIITPTLQNLRNIENDIRNYLPSILDRQEPQIKGEMEKLIRAYDP
ncbi:MAG: Ni/Fe hydrogenase subunit alpha, partial [Candidatus Micrarchaeota archaeon]|nr:Ni/Fe hydrogenase subunit alpha [Candidatus Micrarchaeota archaeon]